MTTATVVFRLAGPQQAWSTAGRGARRPTQDHPTKSGVIGMVANALGRDRADDVTDLAALRFGVRADRPGRIESDYHTSGSGRFPLLPSEVLADPALTRAAAKGLPLERSYAAPKNITRDRKGVLVGKRGDAILTRDEYLVDAAFTIALTGPVAVVEEVAAALRAPARSLHLGRKAYPLSAPPSPSVHPVDDPAAALALMPAPTAPAYVETWIEQEPGRQDGNTQIVMDQPISFGARCSAPRLETRRTTVTAATVDFFTPEDQP